MISARVRTKSLNNALIIVDEPEIGLYPAGVRHLLKELIQLSNNNKVLFCTHSIFMIDATNIGRHLVVEKEKEITTLKKTDKSNFFEEEILFNALGSSTFEVLKEKNIIFEGWTDKVLFETALKKNEKEFNKKKKKFNKVGLCFAVGASSISNISSLLQLARRDCFILTDDDNAAKSSQKKHNEANCHGTWKRYSEILNETTAITAEDFVKKEYLLTCGNRLKKEISSLAKFELENFEEGKGNEQTIKEWLATATDQVPRDILRKFKMIVYQGLKLPNIEDEYFDLVVKISEFFED